MKSHFFHHPDISVSVTGRQAADCFMDLVGFYGRFIATGGRSMFWNSCFPSKTAYYSALSRLKKKGVVTAYRMRDGRPVLRLNAVMKGNAALNPKRFWKAKWDGIWRVLVYDIPETNRAFRNSLRKFLYRLRMGCLQQSVWVSSWDIRPDYADLVKTMGIEDTSFLFESRTVLGRKAVDIVSQAWDVIALEEKQGWFIETAVEWHDRVERGGMNIEDIGTLAREEYLAYMGVMEEDPLLPRKLYPRDYRGEKAYATHLAFCKAIKKTLRSVKK